MGDHRLRLVLGSLTICGMLAFDRAKPRKFEFFEFSNIPYYSAVSAPMITKIGWDLLLLLGSAPTLLRAVFDPSFTIRSSKNLLFERFFVIPASPITRIESAPPPFVLARRDASNDV